MARAPRDEHASPKFRGATRPSRRRRVAHETRPRSHGRRAGRIFSVARGRSAPRRVVLASPDGVAPAGCHRRLAARARRRAQSRCARASVFARPLAPPHMFHRAGRRSRDRRGRPLAPVAHRASLRARPRDRHRGRRLRTPRARRWLGGRVEPRRRDRGQLQRG